MGPKQDQYIHPPIGSSSLRPPSPASSQLKAQLAGRQLPWPGPVYSNHPATPSLPPSLLLSLTPLALWPSPLLMLTPRTRVSLLPPLLVVLWRPHRWWGALQAPVVLLWLGEGSLKCPRYKWRQGGDDPLWSQAGRQQAGTPGTCAARCGTEGTSRPTGGRMAGIRQVHSHGVKCCFRTGASNPPFT